MLGICYGQQLMAQELGGEVGRTGAAEFGKTEFSGDSDSVLLRDQPPGQTVWMSHNDAVAEAPEGFRVTSSTPQTPVASFEHPDKGL